MSRPRLLAGLLPYLTLSITFSPCICGCVWAPWPCLRGWLRGVDSAHAVTHLLYLVLITHLWAVELIMVSALKERSFLQASASRLSHCL